MKTVIDFLCLVNIKYRWKSKTYIISRKLHYKDLEINIINLFNVVINIGTQYFGKLVEIEFFEIILINKLLSLYTVNIV